MNRKQRRSIAAMRQKKDRMIAGLVKNGLTTEDLKKAYEEGYKDGWKDCTDGAIKTCYAAATLGMADIYAKLHGEPETEEEWEDRRGWICKNMGQVDDYVTGYLTSIEVIDAVFKRTGIKLEFGGLDRIQEAEREANNG